MRRYNERMKILSLAHSYVVDSNRQFWNQVAQNENIQVDILMPEKWRSNLFKENIFKSNKSTDSHFRNIFPLKVYFNGNGSFYHFEWIQLFNILNNEKYDSIFIFQETWSFSLAQIILLKNFTKNKGTPIHLAVCQNIIKKKLAFLIPFERLLMLFVTRIWFCTFEIEKVLKWKGIKNHSSYLPFTFDQEIYQANVKKISKPIKLGFIGRVTQEKGILNLLEACHYLISKGIELELHIAGGGELLDLINDNFVIKHGLIPHNEAHLFYHKIHISVLPSLTTTFWKEQFGRVLVESTASGTPVVGSSSGAIPEVIQFIGFGKVFKEGDSIDLADKVLELVNEMQASDYEDRMNKAIKTSIEFAGHRSVGVKLIKQMAIDARI